MKYSPAATWTYRKESKDADTKVCSATYRCRISEPCLPGGDLPSHRLRADQHPGQRTDLCRCPHFFLGSGGRKNSTRDRKGGVTRTSVSVQGECGNRRLIKKK